MKYAPISDADPIIEGTISAITVAIGDLLQCPIGSIIWTLCTSGSLTQTPKAIALESRTTAHTTCRLLLVNTWELYVGATKNNSAAVDNGDGMVLHDEDQIDNTGTNSTAKEAVVIQIYPLGAAAEKKILCRFTGLMTVVTFS